MLIDVQALFSKNDRDQLMYNTSDGQTLQVTSQHSYTGICTRSCAHVGGGKQRFCKTRKGKENKSRRRVSASGTDSTIIGGMRR